MAGDVTVDSAQEDSDGHTTPSCHGVPCAVWSRASTIQLAPGSNAGYRADPGSILNICENGKSVLLPADAPSAHSTSTEVQGPIPRRKLAYEDVSTYGWGECNEYRRSNSSSWHLEHTFYHAVLHRLLKFEPIDLGVRFVVDLWERHLDYWTPYSDMHSQRNSKRSIYHQWCALPTKRALVTHLPHTLPRYMLLDLPRDSFTAWLASDIVPIHYELKLWPGLTISPVLVTWTLSWKTCTMRMSTRS